MSKLTTKCTVQISLLKVSLTLHTMGVKCHRNLWKLIKSCVLGAVICFLSFSSLIINQTSTEKSELEFLLLFIDWHCIMGLPWRVFPISFLFLKHLSWHFYCSFDSSIKIPMVLCKFCRNLFKQKSIWNFPDNYISETDKFGNTFVNKRFLKQEKK